MGALSPGLYLHAHLSTKGQLPMCFSLRLSTSGVTHVYTSIQCQTDRKTLASTWCGHCRERVISHISDFQTRSGLIHFLPFGEKSGPREGERATAAHSGLQPVPDTVVRLFDRRFYLMLFLRSLGAWHYGRAAPSGPWRLTHQPATAFGVPQHQCRDACSFLTLPWLCSQPAN